MTNPPEITYRDGPTGPRAALIGGPDIWEIIQTLNGYRGSRDIAILATSRLVDLTEQQVRTAVAYHAANPEEIDARIAYNARPVP